MYERPSMPRPPYIRVGTEAIICPRGSIFASSTLREQQSDMRSKVSLPSNAPPPTQAPTGQPLFDRGWQQPLDHPGAQPACRVKDAEGTAQPLVLDSVRWLCYLPKSQAAPRRPHFPAVLTSMLCPSLLNTIVPSSSVRSTFTPALFSVSSVLSAG